MHVDMSNICQEELVDNLEVEGDGGKKLKKKTAETKRKLKKVPKTNKLKKSVKTERVESEVSDEEEREEPMAKKSRRSFEISMESRKYQLEPAKKLARKPTKKPTKKPRSSFELPTGFKIINRKSPNKAWKEYEGPDGTSSIG